MQMQEIIETLSAAKAPKKDGKGNPYADRFNHHMPLFEAMQTASRKHILANRPLGTEFSGFQQPETYVPNGLFSFFIIMLW